MRCRLRGLVNVFDGTLTVGTVRSISIQKKRVVGVGRRLFSFRGCSTCLFRRHARHGRLVIIQRSWRKDEGPIGSVRIVSILLLLAEKVVHRFDFRKADIVRIFAENGCCFGIDRAAFASVDSKRSHLTNGRPSVGVLIGRTGRRSRRDVGGRRRRQGCC